MGLFSSSTKVKDPLRYEKKEAAGFLLDLMRGGTPDIPQQQVAGLTSDQQKIQGQLGGYLDDTNANYGQARDYYRDVLAGGYDPRTSDFYKGLRAEAGQLKADTNTAIKRQAAGAGMYHSSPTSANIAANERQVNNALLTQLGGMYENERTRMGQAAQGVQQADAQRVQTTGQVGSLMDVERQIEQARNDALYNQALQMVMFPYQYQTQMASAIFGGSQPVVSGGGMNDFGMLAQMGGGILAGMAAGGTGFFA